MVDAIPGTSSDATEPEGSQDLPEERPVPGSRVKEWIFFPGGEDGTKSPVVKEISKEKLSAPEAARLQDMMNRVSAGETMPKDVKNLGDGVLEFKLHLDHRSYRLAYAEVNGGLVLLALTFFRKTQQRQQKDVKRAKDRLATYLRDASDAQ